jgi:hypothetical protein
MLILFDFLAPRNPKRKSAAEPALRNFHFRGPGLTSFAILLVDAPREPQE